MSGLILLAVLFVWGFICYQFSKFLMKKIVNPMAKNFGIGLLLMLFFLLPLADEIIGGFQFRSLCKKEASVVIYDEKAIGKKLISVGAVDYELREYILPITKLYFSYADMDSKEVLISWNYFKAKGGIVSRSLNILGSDAPYIFNGNCVPEISGSKIFKNLNVEVQYK